MNTQNNDTTRSQATSQRMEFKRAMVRPGIDSGTHILIVSGDKPTSNAEVTLAPIRHDFNEPPEYWGYEVLGNLSGIGAPVVTPYEVNTELGKLIGTKGVEVFGKTRSEKINV